MASWEGSSSDGAPSALSSLIPTAAASCWRVSSRGTSTGSLYGTTSGRSTGARGLGGGVKSMSLQPVGHVRTYPVRARVRASTASAQASGWKLPGSWGRFDRGTSLVRTRQCCWLTGAGELYSGTCPRWGIGIDGELLELTTPELRTSGTASGSLLPTPTANTYGTTNNGTRGDGTSYRTAGTPSLSTMARRGLWPTPIATDGEMPSKSLGRLMQTGEMYSRGDKRATWPTPTAGDAKSSGSRNTAGSKAHAGVSLTDAVRGDGGRGRAGGSRGQLNPTWVESYLMGWPIGWTASEPLATDKFLEWRRSHGACLGGRDA